MKHNVLSRRTSASLNGGGRSAFRVRDPELVIKWCDSIRLNEPAPAPVLYLKGLCLVQKNEIHEGFNCFALALSNGHNTRNLRLARAGIYYLLRQYSNADAEIDAVLEIAPNNFEALWIRALCYYSLNQNADALRAIRLATKSTASTELPANPNDAIQLGRCLGELLYSVSDFGRFLDSLFHPWQAHFWIALMLRSKAKYNEALEHYAKALLLIRNSGENKAACHINRSNIFTDLGDYESALVESVLAVQADPNGLLSLRTRGIDYVNVGRYEDAIADLTAYIEKSTELPIWQSRGICYLQLGRLQDAINDFDRAIQDTPPSLYFFLFRAIAYMRKGDFQQAVADLTKYLDQNPECMTGYKLRGQLLRYLSQQDLIRAAGVDFTQEDSLREAAGSLPIPLYPELVKELVDFVCKLGDQFEDRQHRKRDF